MELNKKSNLFCPLCKNILTLRNRDFSKEIRDGKEVLITIDRYSCDSCLYGEVKSYDSPIKNMDGKDSISRCETCNFEFSNSNIVINAIDTIYKCPICGSACKESYK